MEAFLEFFRLGGGSYVHLFCWCVCFLFFFVSILVIDLLAHSTHLGRVE